jgi:nucleotidyltransferase/DNA polymerase involved in DNA repair
VAEVATGTVIVSLRLPEILWQVECLDAPHLRDQPVVIAGRGARSGRVAAAAPPARRAGVAVGQPVAVARALCPDALVQPGRLDRVIDVASAIRTLVGDRLPGIGWLHVARGVGRFPRNDVHEIQRTIDRLRFALDAAFGVSLACGLAVTRPAADVAARLVSPAGFLYVLPGYEARMLEALALPWLEGVDEGIRVRAAAHGMATISDLARLADEHAISIFGGVGPVLAAIARGDDPRPLPISAEERLTESVQIGERAFAPAVVSALDRLLTRARASGRAIGEVRLRAYDAGPSDAKQFRIAHVGAARCWDSPAELRAAVADALPVAPFTCSRVFVTVMLARERSRAVRCAAPSTPTLPGVAPKSVAPEGARRESA